MNAQHIFIAERAAAQHCAELLRAGPPPTELLPVLGRVDERIAQALRPGLRGLLGGNEPQITSEQPVRRDIEDLYAESADLAVNSLITSDAASVSLLTAIDGGAMLRLVDRAFGGRGEAVGPLPERFPLSAEMMIGRIEELIVGALREAFNLPDLRSQRRAAKLPELAPFAPATNLAVLRLAMDENSKAGWHLLIAVPIAQLPCLLGGDLSQRPAPHRAAADPAATPFADVPLPLIATLVDMRVPLSTLAALEPGIVLPVAVARAVPIASGGAVLARGTIGANDDRVAIKITQIA